MMRFAWTRDTVTVDARGVAWTAASSARRAPWRSRPTRSRRSCWSGEADRRQRLAPPARRRARHARRPRVGLHRSGGAEDDLRWLRQHICAVLAGG
ncbi:MAG: hypothetical protein M5U28_07680 [Sandaracinaceae bacterium]|nr:hypothetical protein [Sandaracinaceae bacterium]